MLEFLGALYIFCGLAWALLQLIQREQKVFNYFRAVLEGAAFPLIILYREWDKLSQ